MKKGYLLLVAVSFVVVLVLAVSYSNLPFSAGQSGQDMEMEDTAGKYDDTVSVEQLNTLLEELDVELHDGEECDLTVLNHMLSSMDLDTCVDFKSEPVLHDGLSKEDVHKLLGDPEYELDNVWIYSKGASLLVFNDGKLGKLARLGTDSEGFYIMEIRNALNIEDVRKLIQEKDELRYTILSSDEELSKLAGLSQDELFGLIGYPDVYSPSSANPYIQYVTDKRTVTFKFDNGVGLCYTEDNETGESNYVFMNDYFKQEFEKWQQCYDKYMESMKK